MFKGNLGFFVPKGSIYYPIINYVGEKMLDVGLVDRIDPPYQKAKESLSCNRDTYVAVGLETIFTAFLVLVLGVIFSLSMVLLELTREAISRCQKV